MRKRVGPARLRVEGAALQAHGAGGHAARREVESRGAWTHGGRQRLLRALIGERLAVEVARLDVGTQDQGDGLSVVKRGRRGVAAADQLQVDAVCRFGKDEAEDERDFPPHADRRPKAPDGGTAPLLHRERLGAGGVELIGVAPVADPGEAAREEDEAVIGDARVGVDGEDGVVLAPNAPPPALHMRHRAAPIRQHGGLSAGAEFVAGNGDAEPRLLRGGEEDERGADAPHDGLTV